MVAGMTSPVGRTAPAADLAALRSQVTPENVMLLHNGLKSEALYIGDQIATHLAVHVGEPGKDLVSPQASKAFNYKIDKLRAELLSYVDLLHSIADDMARAARSYGHTETEIAASFAEFYRGYPQQTGVTEHPPGG
jgi:hypothetical protein